MAAFRRGLLEFAPQPGARRAAWGETRLRPKSRLKIYTKGGDGGETTLLGGARVAKDDVRVAAYGTVDELNAVIGTALALDPEGATLGESGPALGAVQEDLFTIGARLAASNPDRLLRKGTIPALSADRVEALERWIDALDAELPALDAFVLPGGSPLAAQLHVAGGAGRHRSPRGAAGPRRSRRPLHQPPLRPAVHPRPGREPSGGTRGHALAAAAAAGRRGLTESEWRT